MTASAPANGKHDLLHLTLGRIGGASAILQLDAAGKMVWALQSTRTSRPSIRSSVLDVPGDPARAKILR